MPSARELDMVSSVECLTGRYQFKINIMSNCLDNRVAHKGRNDDESVLPPLKAAK